MDGDFETRPVVTRRTLIKAAAGATAALGVAGAATQAAVAAPAARSQISAAFQAATPIPGGTFTYGGSKPAVNIINPLNTIGTGQNVLIEAMFLRLVYGIEWGPDVNPQSSGPIDLAVAETMTEIEKDQIWEFKIRDNVKWHDGEPVTADDVIFGIWLSLNKDAKTTNETPVVDIKGGEKLQQEGGGSVTPPYNIVVEGATKIDDSTVRIELTRPIPNYWVDWSVGYWPMPVHIFGQMPLANLFDEPYATMPVGNGPFKAVKWVEGQYMEMAANEDFYLGRPLVDKYVVRFSDADTLTAALEAGEIDGCNVAAGPVYDRLTSLPNMVGNPVPTTLPYGFVVNFERFPEQGAALTKAMTYAIDVATLNEQLYSNTLVPSNYLFAHVVGFEQPPEGFPTYTYDPDKAMAVLAEANWDSSKELEWIMWGTPTSAQDALQAMLNAVGIKNKYKIIDVATVIEQLYEKGEYDIAFANFGGDQSMAANWQYIKCGWNYDTGGYNYARYCNEEVDTIWAKGNEATDAAERKSLFDQVTMKFADAPPQATIWRPATTYVWNTRVKGAFPYQYHRPVRPVLERVWISED
jgi:peptide/nickel transport system substrate-binding protein